MTIQRDGDASPRRADSASASGIAVGLRVAASPDGDAFERQADLRRDEPCRVILVLRPDVAHGNHCAVALDRPTSMPRGFLERCSVLAEFKALAQGHVEGLR